MFVLHGNIADSPRQVIDALAASGLVRQILIVPVALLLEHIKTNKLFKKSAGCCISYLRMMPHLPFKRGPHPRIHP